MDWTDNSKKTIEFVDKFLDRALGASNDIFQRAPIEPIRRRFYLGKLLPLGYSKGRSEYVSKIAPCSYIASFILLGKNNITLKITPSFNLYFKVKTKRVVNSTLHEIIAKEADPELSLGHSRADMWIPWNERIRMPSKDFKEIISNSGMENTSEEESEVTRETLDIAETSDIFIRKRYAETIIFQLDGDNKVKKESTLKLAEFRENNKLLGHSPNWEGIVEIFATHRENGATRVNIYLTNTAHYKNEPWVSEATWYDTHLKIEFDTASTTIKATECPILKNGNKTHTSIAETKNCAISSFNSETGTLIIGPIAREKTIRQAPRRTVSFEELAKDPSISLKKFLNDIKEAGISKEDLESFEKDVGRILSEETALAAFKETSKVFATAHGPAEHWFFHQLATLVKIAALYLENRSYLQPIVLNIPTAGGKTEAFFSAALFCTFYQDKKKKKAINIIKYPMTLLSNDQAIRLAGYSMIADEIAQKPLGIGYMVGRKDVFNSPEEIVPKCPRYIYGKSGGDKICGGKWIEYKVKAEGPTLTCEHGHKLHMSIDKGDELWMHLPTFVISIWDKFVSQASQRRLGMLFGANRYFCSRHGVIDVADTNQATEKGRAAPAEIKCKVWDKKNKGYCNGNAKPIGKIEPGILVLDEAHLIRESEGTLDSHFETTYIEIAKGNTGHIFIPVISTATIGRAEEHISQLGLKDNGQAIVIPKEEQKDIFFYTLFGELKHETVAVVPFDVMLTWAVPDLIDVFFETLRNDFAYDAMDKTTSPPANLKQFGQVLVYCSSYTNINALMEMNRNAISASRGRRGLLPLKEIQLSSRYFSKVKAQKAIDDVKNVRQQIIYATNIASIGIDIDNLDAIFFFGMPSNVSEFIQAMNRTGRRRDIPAICLAILGPNKERDVSYFRYWHQFVTSADKIIEPVPLNRFAHTAIDRTFYNVASALLLMDYLHRLKRAKFFNAGVLTGVINRREINEGEIVNRLKRIYKVGDDPSGHYEKRVEELWDGFKRDLASAKTDSHICKALENNWMGSLRSIQRAVKVIYPEVSEIIENQKSGANFIGDEDTSQLSTLAKDEI
jgi:hypothetical protein